MKNHPHRLLALSGLLLLLAGCANQPWFQDKDKARVRLGSEVVLEPAVNLIAPVLPYLLLADLAYVDQKKMPTKEQVEPDYDDFFKAYGNDARVVAKAWMAKWQYVAGYEVANPVTDHQAFWLTRNDPLPGLGLHIWRRRGDTCSEAVIAFRGTDGASLPDWMSNLRWFLRLFNFYDQYDQVADGMQVLFNTHRELRDCANVTTVGHSLGGGLAQKAAYVHGKVRRVFAFDPSFVTGYYDIERGQREANQTGLKIERIYEHGEVLAYLRLPLRFVYPPSTVNPQIREMRFNLTKGNIITQHKLNGLAVEMLLLSKEKGVLPPDGPLQDYPSPRRP